MNPQDEILNYVLRKENLPATLDIISRAGEIRGAVLQTFWDGLHQSLKKTMPRRFTFLKNMKWEFWPTHGRSRDKYNTLYYHDPNFQGSVQSLSFCVHDWHGSAFELRHGIMWSKKAENKASRLFKIPAVAHLHQELQSQQYSSTSWWFARSESMGEDSIEAFMKPYFNNPKTVEDKMCGNFWQMVEEHYDQLADANRALRRAKSK